MNRIEVSFDKKGAGFSLVLLAAVFLVGAGSMSIVRALAPATAPSTPAAEVSATLPAAAALSPIVRERVINSLTIPDAVPKEGKFLAADLSQMKLFAYEDGAQIAEYPILTKGRPGTPWETPSGFYSIGIKERDHLSTIGLVYMPFSMQFYGNYFIHGWPYYADGTPVASTFSGGCIRLGTEDAAKVYEFANKGTGLFVYDPKREPSPASLILGPSPKPALSAGAYLVADIDTGDVYIEKDAEVVRPIASVTKLMTALVANEVISFEKMVSVAEGGLSNPPVAENPAPKVFAVGDLLYPLLMQSSNSVADSLASFYGTREFMQLMNATAAALGMAHTAYADPSGMSADNLSTPDDLFRLAAYLANKKSFVFSITNVEKKTLTASDGTSFDIKNVNEPAYLEPFEGGKVGHTTAAKDTLVSVLALNVGGVTRRIAVIVLSSDNQSEDAKRLAGWIANAASADASLANTACAGCAPAPYRKIEF